MPVTLNSVLQVLIFLVIVLRPVPVQDLQRGAHLALAGLRPRGTLLLPALRHQPGGGAEVDGLHDLRADLQRGGHAAPLPARAHPAVARVVLQPGRPGAGRAAPGLQHGLQFYHQHQLAELYRRDDHELPDADGGPHLSPVRLCCRRHCAGGRAGARPRPPQRAVPG